MRRSKQQWDVHHDSVHTEDNSSHERMGERYWKYAELVFILELAILNVENSNKCLKC